MKCSVLIIFLFNGLCFGQMLLGGWSTSSDQALIEECLEKALAHIYQTNETKTLRLGATDVSCRTQVVAGLNIRLSFVHSQQTWRCSYFRSLDFTLPILIEGCHKVEASNESAMTISTSEQPATTANFTSTTKPDDGQSSTQQINGDDVDGEAQNQIENFNAVADQKESADLEAKIKYLDEDEAEIDRLEKVHNDNDNEDE